MINIIMQRMLTLIFVVIMMMMMMTWRSQILTRRTNCLDFRKECEPSDGFMAARGRALKEKLENNSDDDIQERTDQREDKVPEEGSWKRKHKTALLETARQAMMDEYYKLDYEDTIGDLKTRFKYAKTKPSRFGMNASEILLMDDKELNQHVSLKKLAPFQEKEWKLSKQKRYALKTRTKALLRAASSDKKNKKKSKSDSVKSTSSNDVDNAKASIVESNTTAGNLSRKARRKQQAASLKLSHERLLAYGKMTSKSKHGVKN